ncbi:sulfite exporter TauE/SafE family protein [Schlegelella sp. S2-27]|uniref:Probable membrane transporter protein n=1 Tax=Caldimonas mangrovi TaxID=2944811 RepID=A0ABT0YS29_9BURK|nr:sulfite exporter TauE/SafE family protein [Caldimonas mangrovi]MCM5681433.1 sulfite exporter TauE/SafE family protein [Caldimonas mangrovi]
MDFLNAFGIAVVFALAGCVKGITGMGLPTVAVSLLGLWLPPVQAAALLIVPSLATNLAQCRGPHARVLVAALWPAWGCLALVTSLAPAAGAGGAGPDARALLGLTLVLYGVWGLWRPSLPDLARHRRWAGPCAGVLTGLVAASTAVFVMPLVPYLQALRLQKDVLVQALGLSFTVATLALAVRVGAAPEVSLLSPGAAVALLAACAGLACGNCLRSRLSGTAFQRALFVTFAALGIANLMRLS